MKEILKKWRGKLIVSSQAEGDDPFNNPADVAKFARAAEMGGAAGIRTEGVAKTKAVCETVKAPVVSLLKGQFADGTVCITRNESDVAALIEAGAQMIAIDGTFRIWNGDSGPDFIAKMIQKFPQTLFMADIATTDEALACEKAAVHCVSTTLGGYTPETAHRKGEGPDWDLLKSCVARLSIPVIAEGRYNTPDAAVKAIRLGAWAVVAGTAITRPRVITGWFAEKLRKESDGAL
ncbi:MAG TPA: putative N-acetylmannosamine-6-phosphate 2-epimerase [Candidatus Marinimicrobia bacterium]|nr:putative N-acetylmannosamine-6-phosphate 2-epimerase [Candidatus Neomarinimicrobiota bacterium]